MRVQLPEALAKRVDDYKKYGNGRGRTKQGIVVSAIDRGLDDGIKPILRSFEDNEFVPVSDYFATAADLKFVGADSFVVAEQESEFLFKKVLEGCEINFIAEESIVERFRPWFENLNEAAKTVNGGIMVKTTDKCNLNAVFSFSLPKMMTWVDLVRFRGPINYFNGDIMDRPMSLVTQYCTDLLLGSKPVAL